MKRFTGVRTCYFHRQAFSFAQTTDISRIFQITSKFNQLSLFPAPYPADQDCIVVYDGDSLDLTILYEGMYVVSKVDRRHEDWSV
jgi:hypothetical protein